MVQLIGFKRIKTAIFISGRGSNLKSLIKFSKTKSSPISIDLIISNNHNAKGLKYANIFKIKKEYLDLKIRFLQKKNTFRSKKI